MNPVPATLRLLAAACLSAACAATAGNTPPDGPPANTIDFPAGWACADFGLRIEEWPGHLNDKTMKDLNGYSRVRLSGLGAAWRLSNLSNGKSMTTSNNGAAGLIQISQADGSVRYTINGHSLFIQYPTDLPPGPFAKLIAGKLDLSIAPTGQGTLNAMKGDVTDVCSVLN